jgi:hypothetical protein
LFVGGSPTPKSLSFVCAKESNQRKSHPAAASSFGLSAASGRLRNSLRSNSPRRYPSAAQAEGAARGEKVKTMRMRRFIDALQANIHAASRALNLKHTVFLDSFLLFKLTKMQHYRWQNQ